MDPRKLARLCLKLADEKKAEDSVILDVRKLTSITDYFVILSGTSEPHLRAIAGEIMEKLREQEHIRPRAMDGSLQSSWFVLDYDSVIVHLMRPEVRQRYDLEALWSDAPRVNQRKTPALVEPATAKPRKAKSKSKVKKPRVKKAP